MCSNSFPFQPDEGSYKDDAREKDEEHHCGMAIHQLRYGVVRDQSFIEHRTGEEYDERQ
jgi:hypothetical protein